MSFRLWTIFYVFALVAAALAAFGAWGIIAAGYVLGFWAWKFYAPKRDFTLWNLLFAFAIVALLIAMLLPAVQSAREAARRNQCLAQLKQLAYALAMYESVHGTLPPAYVADADGNPMHSWRVLILPYLEQDALYEQYDFKEPWDGPNNRKLASQIGDVYRCPGHYDESGTAQRETNYVAVIGPETAWPGDLGRKATEIRDGIANTLLLIEATGLGIDWMEPRDVTLDQAMQLMTSAGSGHLFIDDAFLSTTYYESSQRCVVYCDTHLEAISQLNDPGIVSALFSVAGGEAIPASFDTSYSRRVVKTFIKWKKVYAMSVFVVLALLPAAWARRRAVRPLSGDSGSPE